MKRAWYRMLSTAGLFPLVVNVEMILDKVCGFHV